MNGGARAAVGVAILAVAALLVVLGPRLAPDRVDGVALTDWPPPPAVGACVNLPERGAVQVVDCDRAHDAEVTRNWAATDPALDASPAIWMDRACSDAAADYVGRVEDAVPVGIGPGGSWWRAAVVSYAAFDIGAPDEERAAGRGWHACIVRPTIPARYVGSVRGSAPVDLDVGAVPEAYRSCLDSYGTAASCTIPHASEVIAIGTYVTDFDVAPADSGPVLLSTDGTDGGKPESVAGPPDDSQAQPGYNPHDAVPSLDQIAEQQAERAAQLARGLAMAKLAETSQGSATTLAAGCLDLPGGLLPNIAHTGATVGLSSSTRALEPTEGGGARAIFQADIGYQTVLRLDTIAGFQAFTAACVITAPNGYQFTRSVLGWTGDTLPLIPN